MRHAAVNHAPVPVEEFAVHEMRPGDAPGAQNSPILMTPGQSWRRQLLTSCVGLGRVQAGCAVAITSTKELVSLHLEAMAPYLYRWRKQVPHASVLNISCAVRSERAGRCSKSWRMQCLQRWHKMCWTAASLRYTHSQAAVQLVSRAGLLLQRVCQRFGAGSGSSCCCCSSLHAHVHLQRKCSAALSSTVPAAACTLRAFSPCIGD